MLESRDKYIFLQEEQDLIDYSNSHKGKKYDVSRLKGLGELSEEETDVLVNPEIRNIKPITVSDAQLAEKMVEDLMGTAILPRKEYIAKYSHETKIVLY